MNTRSKVMSLLAGLTLAATAPLAVAGTITDTFDTAHDYYNGGSSDVSGTIWDGLQYGGGGSDEISNISANANTTSAGQLFFESAKGDWEFNLDDGLLLYINVSGDFVAEVQVTSASNGQYNDAGLMARVADDALAGPGEDWVYLRYSTYFNSNQHRNTDNGGRVNTDYSGSPALVQFLQIERSGNDFIFRLKENAGDSWITFGSVTRADMDGLALQVGLFQASFVNNTHSATFDNFSLTAASVPEPSSLALLGLGGLCLVHRRRKS